MLPRPPSYLRLPVGSPSRATKVLTRSLPDRKSGRRTKAQQGGLDYERKAGQQLISVLPGTVLGQWWEYLDSSGVRRCQTDAYFLHPSSLVTVFEIKRNHTVDAWWQLIRLYRPVLESWPEAKGVNVVEMCHTFDPDVKPPEPTQMVFLTDDLLSTWFTAKQSAYGVYRWRP